MYRIYIGASKGRDPDNPKDRKHSLKGRSQQMLELNLSGVCNTITTVGKDNFAYIEYY